MGGIQAGYYVIAGLVALLAALSYVYKAGQWTKEREGQDDRLAKLEADYRRHVEEVYKKHVEDAARQWNYLRRAVSVNDSRLTRVENDRRIVIFPRDRRRDEFPDEEEG